MTQIEGWEVWDVALELMGVVAMERENHHPH